uniref:Membrane protein n=1 Tax=uncultured organism TaxID=155900 RepID=M1QAP7_9ZZZZ|nr:membrane protein [uncultured organism]
MNSEENRHPIKAMIMGIVYLVLLVIVPIVSISMITGSYPDYEYIFEDVTSNIIIFGTIVAVLGAITAYFDKGEIYRMVSGITKTGFLGIYIFSVISGLDLSIDIEQVTAEIALPGILALMLILVVIKAGYFPLEYYLYGIKDEGMRGEKGLF